MTLKYNIFIEGIPGSGKSTLINTLSRHLPDYHVFGEGDVSPIELAWCAYLNEEEYHKALMDMAVLKDEIENKTIQEGCHYIIPYTKIHTDKYEFYEYMEKHEVYGGRRELSAFRTIIQKRFEGFHLYGNIFECSFFQNVLEELMLFAMYNENQIVEFYKDIISSLDMSAFKLIRLVPADIELCINTIKSERINEKGEEVWYEMMINYLRNSPYGKKHHIQDFGDVAAHFERRTELENKVMKLFPPKCCFDVKSRCYEVSDILRNLN